MIIPPTRLWSRSGTASATSSLDEFPPSNAVDGTSRSVVKADVHTNQYIVTLSSAAEANVFGIVHHNIDRDNVCLFQSDGGLDRGAAARRPNFWLDLRGFLTIATDWTFGVNNNSRPLMIGEIVIGTAYEFNGVVATEPEEDITLWQERQVMKYGKVAISAAKAAQRRMSLTLQLNQEEVVNFEQVTDEANFSGEPVVVIPDSRRNDLWFVQWPARTEIRYEKSAVADIDVRLDLVEESAGVVL